MLATADTHSSVDLIVLIAIRARYNFPDLLIRATVVIVELMTGFIPCHAS
jgi:hypothetical protein